MAGFYQKLLIRLSGRRADVTEAELAAEALEDENEALHARSEAIERENEALRARVAELEAQAARR